VRAALKELQVQPPGVPHLHYCFQLEVYGRTPSREVLPKAADAIWRACGSDPLYFRYKDKPLLIPFAGEASAESWQDDRFTVCWITPAPGSWKYYENFPQSVNRECMCVSPGACNLLEYLTAPHVVGSIFSKVGGDGGAYLARQLKWALDNQPDLIFISSWNDGAFGNTMELFDE
jgi:hypothetical protein